MNKLNGNKLRHVIFDVSPFSSFFLAFNIEKYDNL